MSINLNYLILLFVCVVAFLARFGATQCATLSTRCSGSTSGDYVVGDNYLLGFQFPFNATVAYFTMNGGANGTAASPAVFMLGSDANGLPNTSNVLYLDNTGPFNQGNQLFGPNVAIEGNKWYYIGNYNLSISFTTDPNSQDCSPAGSNFTAFHSIGGDTLASQVYVPYNGADLIYSQIVGNLCAGEPSARPSGSPSSVGTPSDSTSPSNSPSLSLTPSDSVSPSLSVSDSTSPSNSLSMSLSPSDSTSPSPSVSGSTTPSNSASLSLTPSDSISPSPSVSGSITPTASVAPSQSPVPYDGCGAFLTANVSCNSGGSFQSNLFGGAYNRSMVQGLKWSYDGVLSTIFFYIGDVAPQSGAQVFVCGDSGSGTPNSTNILWQDTLPTSTPPRSLYAVSPSASIPVTANQYLWFGVYNSTFLYYYQTTNTCPYASQMYYGDGQISGVSYILTNSFMVVGANLTYCPSSSPSQSTSLSPSATLSPSLTVSPSLSPSGSVSSSFSSSPSVSETPSITPSNLPSPSITPSNLPSPSQPPSPTPVPLVINATASDGEVFFDISPAGFRFTAQTADGGNNVEIEFQCTQLVETGSGSKRITDLTTGFVAKSNGENALQLSLETGYGDVLIDLELKDKDATIQFADSSLDVLAGHMKLLVSLANWQPLSDATVNQLKCQLTSVASSFTKQFLNLHLKGNLYSLDIGNSDYSSSVLIARSSLLDGRAVNNVVTVDDTSIGSITVTFPPFSDTLQFDPAIGILPSGVANSGNGGDGDGDDNGRAIGLGVGLALGLGLPLLCCCLIVMIVIIVVIVVVVYKKRDDMSLPSFSRDRFRRRAEVFDDY